MPGQKFVQFFVGLFGKFKTPKFHSEITWPLPREDFGVKF